MRFLLAAIMALTGLVAFGKAPESPAPFTPYAPAVAFEEADRRAAEIVASMSLEDKFELVSGHNHFFVKGLPQYGIPEFYMTDASVGVHIRKELSEPKNNPDSPYVMARSTAFPATIALASTWNRSLAYEAARAIGEECRFGNIAVLLGPGVNIYRTAHNGRNFEYLGEDPYLSARMAEQFVAGVQSTGTIATLKHFVCNNFEYKRHIANSIVDRRTLNEIYLPAFKAGIDAGALAVMTSYNLVNGEWTGQSRHWITDVLRGQLGFRNLVMTDWASIYDAGEAIRSGLSIEMPGNAAFPFANLRTQGQKELFEGRVSEEDIDRMLRTTICTFIMAGDYDRPVKDEAMGDRYDAHEQTALQVAREGIVLLRNDGLLPLSPAGKGSIVVTGPYADRIARGGGSSEVEGFNTSTVADAMCERFGDRARFLPEATDDQLREAEAVILCVGSRETEGGDHPFVLPEETQQVIERAAALNPNVVVAAQFGSGWDMSGWNDKVAAILYIWYPGQAGCRAAAEIIAGDVNPSGKLPITIERNDSDSPAYGYIPAGKEFERPYRRQDHYFLAKPQVTYSEGIFVGYRWYESRNIEPLYPFGFGLSYTSYVYSSIKAPKKAAVGEPVKVSFTVRNTGRRAGSETVQLYVADRECSLPRPVKELKAFHKTELKAGESKRIELTLEPEDFAFFDPDTDGWKVEAGAFDIYVGGSSADTPLKTTIELTAE